MTTLEELEARVRRLEDVQAITRLKHRYFRLLDQHEWDELRDCFTDDVETHYENSHYCFSSIDDVMRFLSESLGGLRASGRYGLHLGHHPEIELLGANEARGDWTLHAVSLEPENGRVGRQESFYTDEYRRVNGEWRISKTGYTGFVTASWSAADLTAAIGGGSDTRELNATARRS